MNWEKKQKEQKLYQKNRQLFTFGCIDTDKYIIFWNCQRGRSLEEILCKKPGGAGITTSI